MFVLTIVFGIHSKFFIVLPISTEINKFIKQFFSLFYKKKCTRPSDVFRTPTWPIDIGHTICPGLTPLLWVYLLMSYMVNTTLLDRIKSF